jgi:hypothetical protein
MNGYFCAATGERVRVLQGVCRVRFNLNRTLNLIIYCTWYLE